MCLSNKLLSAISLSCLIGNSLGYVPGSWTYDIPPAEASALAGIVEDIPPRVNLTARSLDLLKKRKDNLSPEYPLVYRTALPIPPVKQPTK